MPLFVTRSSKPGALACWVANECRSMSWFGADDVGCGRRIGPANGGVRRYHENGYSGGQRGPTRPAVHIRPRRSGCGSEGNNATGGKHWGSGQGGGKVGNARVGSLSPNRRDDDEHECPCLAVLLMPLPNAYQKELKKVRSANKHTFLCTKAASDIKAGNACE
ncbi:hypothetical protein K438DRAFT_1777809 [Mycena galopus ATCC 62051]|nr:hypothetical protein K438DRAFT_1777809 [Mycena galopus ATCC 62051]